MCCRADKWHDISDMNMEEGGGHKINCASKWPWSHVPFGLIDQTVA